MGIKSKNKKKRIIISVTNDLVTDNRVHKVSTTLLNSGFEVLLVGRKLKFSEKINRNYKTKRFKLFFRKSFLFYAEYNLRLFFFLLFAKCDILLSNDLDTLFSNFIASKIRKKTLVYDSHELFTEVPELINRPKIQKIWEKIEKFTLPKVQHSYTVCDLIAGYYYEKYNIKMKVVRNVPFYNPCPLSKNINEKKIIIYQGAVNINRGLEEAIEAMQFLNEFELWIFGIGDIIDNLRKLSIDLNLQEKVKFFGRKNIEELTKFTSQADLGISFEKNTGLNYYFALPNKIFDYIQSEIPVLCSNLPEMRNIIEKYNIGQVLNSHDPIQIASQIKNIFSDLTNFNKWQNNLKTAKKELCWENEEKVLKEIFLNI